METQELSNSSNDLCPKGIVEQLLEIADKYDCISEIGNATAWRWREGIISRMPKKNTVARILNKAFNTDSPSAWLRETNGDLNFYIKNSFNIDRDSDKIITSELDDIYEMIFGISAGDGKGISFDELVYKIAYFKFCKNQDSGSDYFADFDESLVLKVNGKWAEKKALEIIKKFNIEVSEDGRYRTEGGTFSSESANDFTSEIIQARLKATSGRSEVDMWRNVNAALSDEEMIELELMYIDFQNKILGKIEEMQDRKIRDLATLRTRMFRTNCITLPNNAGEGVK